jgi:hypothetical protein
VQGRSPPSASGSHGGFVAGEGISGTAGLTRLNLRRDLAEHRGDGGELGDFLPSRR